jgi:polygalacturonase
MKRVLSYLILPILVICVFWQTYIYGKNDTSEFYTNKSLEMSSVIRLKELDVLQVTEQGFKLEDKTTRLEALVVLIRLLGKEKATDVYSNIKCKYSDVPEWGIKYVNYAFENNLLKGISDNAFGSRNHISSKEFIVLLLRTLGYSEDAKDFSLGTAIEKSSLLGLITRKERSFYNTEMLTKGSLAVLSSRAIDTKIKSGEEELGAALNRLNSSRDTESFNVLKSGACGNGKTDDTYAIQKAIDKYDDIYIPDGVYLIDGSIGLRPRSNQNIRLSEHAVLKIIPNSSTFYFAFLISDIRNTTIEGGTIIGDRYSHMGNDGENGIGIDVRSNNKSITIKNMRIKEFWGDGISVGDDIISENIKLEAIICSDNRRQGLSIKNARDIVIEDCLFENSNGCGSQAGIRIQAKAGGAVKNVSILNTFLINSDGSGISLTGEKGEITGVKIKNCLSSNNDSGIYLNTCRNITIENSEFSDNTTDGLMFIKDVTNVRLSKVSSKYNGLRGVSIVVAKQKEGTRDFIFSNCIFLNNSKSASGKYDAVRIDNYDSSKMLKNIKFISCSFIDDQEVPKQRYGLTVGDNAMCISNIIVETNCVFKGNIVNDMLSNNIVLMRASSDDGDTLNIRDVGAMGDGITDDTAAIQRALMASKSIVVPAGIYMIDTKVGLRVSSNQSILFEEGANFKAIPNKEDFYRILDFSGARNVTITGGIFIGDRNSHLSKRGEWGTGVYISSNSQGISIKGSRFEGFWGDGIYIGGDIPPKNIKIDDVVCDNNLRSGISITNAKNVTISNSEFSNTKGKEPQTGINIEPESGEVCEDITISGTKCFNNAGNGINLLGCRGSIKNIEILNTESCKNTDGIYMDNCENITIDSSTIIENRNFGLSVARDVAKGSFKNLIISKNASLGASLVTTSQKKGLTDLVFSGCTFSNNGLSKPNTNDGIRIGIYDNTGTISNVRFYSCRFIDNQVSHTQRYGIIIYKEEKVSDIHIDETCYFSGNIKGNIKY